MPEVLVSFNGRVSGESGQVYRPQACGRVRKDGLWEGWIEFIPALAGPVVRTPRETTQPNRNDLQYWASGLTTAYLEGALHRALRSTAPAPAPTAPAFEGAAEPPAREPLPAISPAFDGPAEPPPKRPPAITPAFDGPAGPAPKRPPPATTPTFDGPAGPPAAEPPRAVDLDGPVEPPPATEALPPARAVLDPFAVFAEGDTVLRDQLRALGDGQLRNIARAYRLLDPPQLTALTRAELIASIVEAVRRSAG